MGRPSLIKSAYVSILDRRVDLIENSCKTVYEGSLWIVVKKVNLI